MDFALVAAVEENNGLGKNNTLVWRLRADMKFFTDITTKTQDPSKRNAVIMGRNTWESIPANHRPLKNRINIILSSKVKGNPNKEDMVMEMWEMSLENALELCNLYKEQNQIENVYVIGGAMLYTEAINHPACKTIYLTRIHKSFDCDAFFPEFDENIFKIKERSGIHQENDIDFEFLTYERA